MSHSIVEAFYGCGNTATAPGNSHRLVVITSVFDPEGSQIDFHEKPVMLGHVYVCMATCF